MAAILKTKHGSSSRCSLRPRRAEEAISRIVPLSTIFQHQAPPGLVPTLQAVNQDSELHLLRELSPASSEMIPADKSPSHGGTPSVRDEH